MSKKKGPDPLHLGDRVKDEITGYEGVVYSITSYMHGCRRINVAGKKVDAHGNIEPVNEYFDELQLSLLESNEDMKAKVAMVKSLSGGVAG